MAYPVILPARPQRGHEEWDGTPTPFLEPWLHELQANTSTNEGSSTTDIAPVSSGQLPRQSGRDDLIPCPRVMNSNLDLQGISGGSYQRA